MVSEGIVFLLPMTELMTLCHLFPAASCSQIWLQIQNT